MLLSFMGSPPLGDVEVLCYFYISAHDGFFFLVLSSRLSISSLFYFRSANFWYVGCAEAFCMPYPFTLTGELLALSDTKLFTFLDLRGGPPLIFWNSFV